VLHTVSPSDGLANSLVQGLVAAEQKVNELSAEFGPQHPEVVKAVARVKDYQERLRKRAEGFMLGLEAKTASLENSIETLQHEVESVQRREAESASRARPYWEARRKVDQLVELRRVFALKLATEQTESKFYRTPAVEIVEEAVATGRPSTTRAPGAACVLLGLLLAVVGSWVARSGNG
jgi:uncharacterized protein involved in exopolysaccharide biosynthesis